MTFQNELGRLKKAIDKQLEKYLDLFIREAQGDDLLLAQALGQLKKIALSGGKRIRGALLCQAYWGFGGKEKNKIIKIAAAIELVHLYLLIHDDIIDRGKIRHGEMTLNNWFAKKQNKKLNKDEAEHFGNSMAIIVGDLLYAKAIEIILQAGLGEKNTSAAIGQLQKIVANTIVGQSQDINISYDEKIKEKDILKMYENKTAKYTFEGPLQMGALLAGEHDKKIFQKISNFAIPFGVAFQIQDDMLGVFGETIKTGKSASDIEEGKKTLLVSKAESNADFKQKKQMQNILGKKNISSNEIKNFQFLMNETGAAKYNREMINHLFIKGRQEVETFIILPPAKKFLLGMVDYLEKREI